LRFAAERLVAVVRSSTDCHPGRRHRGAHPAELAQRDWGATPQVLVSIRHGAGQI